MDYEGVTAVGRLSFAPWSVFCSVERLLLCGVSFALWSVGLAAVVTCLMSSCLDPGLAWRLPLAWHLTHGGPLRGLWLGLDP